MYVMSRMIIFIKQSYIIIIIFISFGIQTSTFLPYKYSKSFTELDAFSLNDISMFTSCLKSTFPKIMALKRDALWSHGSFRMHHVPGGPVRRGHAGAAPARSLGYKRQVEYRISPRRTHLHILSLSPPPSLSLSQKKRHTDLCPSFVPIFSHYFVFICLSFWHVSPFPSFSLSLKRGKVVGRDREKWRKDRDEEGANRVRKKRNPGQLR